MEYAPQQLREIGDLLDGISEIDSKLKEVTLASKLPVLGEDGDIIGSTDQCSRDPLATQQRRSGPPVPARGATRSDRHHRGNPPRIDIIEELP